MKFFTAAVTFFVASAQVFEETTETATTTWPAAEHETTATTTTTINVLGLLNTANALLDGASVQHREGAWLYCDWKSFPKSKVADVLECNQKCADEPSECSYWNYDVVTGICDLKSCQRSGDGYLEKNGDWINGVGTAVRRLRGQEIIPEMISEDDDIESKKKDAL